MYLNVDFLHKKANLLVIFFRVIRAASHEERGEMHVGIYETETSCSQHNVLHEQPFTLL